MGSYNSQYEDYYTSLKKRSRATYSPYYKKTFSFSKGESYKDGYWVKRIMRDFIGVFLLFVFVIVCKLIVTPKTAQVYNYSKELVNKNYDYKSIIDRGKSLNFNKLQDDMINIIETIRSKVTGKDTVKDKIRKEFILPIRGNETSVLGYIKDPVTKENKFDAGIDIEAKENTEVKASYNGKVKDCGEDSNLGKYILIDHGDGIETKYANLKEILIKKGDGVEKSQVVGKSGNKGKYTEPHFHFELLYMGENKDPSQYFESIKN